MFIIIKLHGRADIFKVSHAPRVSCFHPCAVDACENDAGEKTYDSDYDEKLDKSEALCSFHVIAGATEIEGCVLLQKEGWGCRRERVKTA